MFIKLPPVHFLLLLLGIVAVWVFNIGPFVLAWPARALGMILIPLGLGLLGSARMLFRRRAANIMTFGEPNNLVTEGPFRYSRNPMYLGFTLVLFGAAALSGHLVALVAPLGFWLLAHGWYVPFEERAAQLAFGPAYEAYCNKTRRWI